MPVSEAKESPRLELKELYRINWLLGGVLALFSIWTALYLEFEAAPFVVLGSVLIGIGLLRPRWVAKTPAICWRVMPFLLVVFLAIDLYRFGELLPALVRLNLLLIVYRALSFRKKREDLQLLLLCLFMIVIAGVLTVALSFIVQLLAFIALGIWFLFNMTLMEHEREHFVAEEVWDGFSWRSFLSRIWAMKDPRAIAMGGLTFVSLIGISSLLFLIIPRLDMQNRIPFLAMGGGSQTGFSESIRLGDVTDMKNDNKVALRVEISSDGEGPPPGLRDPYWRMLALDEYFLDEYGHSRFRVSHSVRRNATSSSEGRQFDRDDPVFGSTLHPPVDENEWVFYLESGVARYLPLAGSFESIRFQGRSNLLYYPPLSVMGMRDHSGMLVYRVSDMEATGEYFDPEFGNYTLDFPWHPDMGFFPDFERYVNYPETTLAVPAGEASQAVLERIVKEIRDGDDLDAEEFTGRAVEYLRERHDYSMSFTLPPGREIDPVVRWLESDRSGHCEMFAAALILLCRTADYPARAVTGFHGGSWNAHENYFMVRYSDAHAWAEVYDGYGRWFRVDPTPADGSPGAAGVAEAGGRGIALDSSFAAYLDSLRIVWYRRVVSFDRTTQFQLMDWARQSYRQLDLQGRLAGFRDMLRAWASAPWDDRRLLEVLGIVGSGFFLFLLVWVAVRRDLSNFRTHLDPSKRQCRVRRKAGLYLRRLHLRPGADDERARALRELREIRYGSERYHGDHKEVFRRARRLARRRTQWPVRRTPRLDPEGRGDRN